MSEEGQVAESTEAQAVDSGVVTEGGDPLLQPEEQSRPEWLPEKFKSAEDLAAAYSSLEGKLGQKEQELKESFLKEIEEQAFENRPADKGDYQLPEGIDDTLASDNELLGWWANHAFENGFSQEEFSEGINMYVNAINANVPDYNEELAKLGDNASARTEAISLFANQFFPENVMPAIERMCETADGVMALEHIMENIREGGPSGDSIPAAQTNEKELKQMMLDPRYHDPVRRDPVFIKQVEEGFKKLYG